MGKFVFLEELPRRFDWPVDVHVPGAGAQKFTAAFEELGQDDLDRIAEGERADAELARRVLVGWSGVVDDTGAEVPFSDARRDALIARPYARYAIARGYYEAILGHGRGRGN